nr:phage terminase small subunit P27 family [Rhizobium sp. ACO-34A]
MKGNRPHLAALDGSLLKAPPMPATLPPEAKADWQTAAADLAGRGLLPSAVLPVLEAYVGALWMARKCREAIATHGVLVKARGDQWKPNPAASMLAKSNDVIARLSDDLGISPVGRSRSGIKGQASAHEKNADPFVEFDI